jgi:hypothetical protein
LIHNIIRQIGIGINLLHIVAIFQRLDQTDQPRGTSPSTGVMVWGTMVTSATR